MGTHQRTSTPEPCPRCGVPTIVGRPSDMIGWDVRCDPQPLDKLGEVLALMSGRATFCLRLYGLSVVVIDERDIFAKVGSPAGRCDVDVIVEHHCEFPQDRLTHAPSVLKTRFLPRAEDYDGPCPY